MSEVVESELVKSRLPCLDEVNCGSSDAMATYSDGHSHCFSCGTTFWPETSGHIEPQDKRVEGLMHRGEFRPLDSRGISEETCRKFGYYTARYGNRPCQIAEYHKGRKITAQHLRFPDKDFIWLGDSKGVELFGQHLWADGGKSIIICEGEIDTLTWSQVRSNRWPVVGVCGVTAAIKQVKDNIVFLSSFEEIYVCMDMDEPGTQAASKIADLLPPGKVKIICLPCKDANDTYRQKGAKTLYDTLWQAKPYAPEEVTSPLDVLLYHKDSGESIYHYPFPPMEEATGGQRQGEVIVVGAGTSVGKSTLLRYLAWDALANQHLQVGYLPFEESSYTVTKWLVSYDTNTPMDDMPNSDKLVSMLSNCEWSNRLSLFTDRGRPPHEIVMDRIRFMAVGRGCECIFIDHISALFASMPGDERKEIDKFMYALQALAKELGVVIFSAAHLKDPPTGKPLEEGGSTSLRLLRGSGSIRQVPDVIWGVERDSTHPTNRLISRVVSLKQRLTGNTGPEYGTYYTFDNSRLSVTDAQYITQVGEDTDDYFGGEDLSDF